MGVIPTGKGKINRGYGEKSVLGKEKPAKALRWKHRGVRPASTPQIRAKSLREGKNLHIPSPHCAGKPASSKMNARGRNGYSDEGEKKDNETRGEYQTCKRTSLLPKKSPTNAGEGGKKRKTHSLNPKIPPCTKIE